MGQPVSEVSGLTHSIPGTRSGRDFSYEEGSPMKENKKLVKDLDNKLFCGVCSGLASYFNVDVTLVRLIFGFLGFWGPGIALYLLAVFLMPSE